MSVLCRPRRISYRKLLYRRIPVLSWAPQYKKSFVAGDIIAGITVGLMTVPQALAYSIVAGLPHNVSMTVPPGPGLQYSRTATF